MSAKTLLPNQHMPLHFIYGQHGCCLCDREQQLDALRAQRDELVKAGRLAIDVLGPLLVAEHPDAMKAYRALMDALAKFTAEVQT